MWNKRREEEPPKPFSPLAPQGVSPNATSSPAPATQYPVEPKKEISPVSSTPVSRFEPATSANSIGKSVKIVGQIYSKEDLYVDGTVEGTLEASEHKLTIGPHGTIQAAIKAREVLVLGTIQGNVEAFDAWRSAKTPNCWATSAPRASSSRTAPTSRAASTSSSPNL